MDCFGSLFGFKNPHRARRLAPQRFPPRFPTTVGVAGTNYRTVEGVYLETVPKDT